MKAIQTLTIAAVMILASTSMASTKCKHRLSSGSSLFDNTAATSSVAVQNTKVASAQNLNGVK